MVRKAFIVVGGALLMYGAGLSDALAVEQESLPLQAGQYKGSNVIFIELADVRRDHLGSYGYDKRPVSPNLDAVAQRGVRFEHVVAVAPWCVPGKNAIWTGLYPSGHGVTNKYTKDAQGKIVRAILSDAIPTFPELLKAQAGYTLVGFTGGAGVAGISGLSRGFDVYIDDVDFAGYNRTVPLALDWLREEREEPFFMFLQGYTAHGQAIPEKPYERIFAKDYQGDKTGSAAEHKKYREESLKLRFHKDGPQIDALGFSPEDKELYLAIYDEKVRAVDWWVGEFLNSLDELALSRQTIIVIFSGHGDEYFDHGFLDHGPNLYEEVTHVPAFMLLPGAPGGQVVESQIRTIDLFPTVFELLGLSHHSVSGVSVVPALNGHPMSLVGYSETQYRYFTDKSALVTPNHRYKFIFTHDTGHQELYDLLEDPTEQQNLIAENPALAETLEQQLLEIRQEIQGGNPEIEDLQMDARKP